MQVFNPYPEAPIENLKEKLDFIIKKNFHPSIVNLSNEILKIIER